MKSDQKIFKMLSKSYIIKNQYENVIPINLRKKFKKGSIYLPFFLLVLKIPQCQNQLVKKLILVLVVILISTNTIHAANFKWTKIVTTADGATEFYIEKNSIRKLGNFHYYWSLANYLILEEGDDPNEKSSITFNILNCKTREVKTVTFTSFYLNKGRGKFNSDFIVPDIDDSSYFDWKHYGENTSFGRVFKEVCKIS